MLNAFHSPQSVALLGATSEIGQAILKALPQESLNTCFAVARDTQRAGISLKGILPNRTKIIEIAFHAEATQTHRAIVEQLFSEGDLDVAIIAAGVLGNNPGLDEFENAIDVMTVNYVACANLMLLIAEKMKLQGHGQIEIISSFAQTRPRVDNFIYGSSKAGLDFMARGLNDKLEGTGVSVSIVRPGFVRTRMTKSMQEAPFAVNADAVGKVAVDILKSEHRVGYAPSILKFVAFVFALLPTKIFKRISNR